jgi:hypothetical protein
VKALKKFSSSKQRLFIFLNFEFLRETSNPDPEKEKELQEKFIHSLKEQIGVKLASEFVEWGMTLNQEAFIKEEDGSYYLKLEYR